jgi:alkyl hydroperoxide reductase subunit AhpF
MLKSLYRPVQLRVALGETEADRQMRAVVDTLVRARPPLFQCQGSTGAAQDPAGFPTPTLQLMPGDGPDPGIRFQGPPTGYQFGALVEAVRDVSIGETTLAEETRRLVSAAAVPIRLRVFVTPTCPFCPRMVRLAHMLALVSPVVEATAVDATVFPDEAVAAGVSVVPLLVADRPRDGARLTIGGVVPEREMVRQLAALWSAADG